MYPAGVANKEFLLRSLKVCHDQLLTLRMNEQVWQALIGQVKRYPELGRPGEFLRFVAMTHQTTMAVGLRRVTDDGKETHSFLRVLQAIAERQFVIRRRDYALLFGTSREAIRRGEADFARIIGSAGAEFPATIAEKHRHQLVRIVDPIRSWVDQRVAHNDRRPLRFNTPRVRHLRHAWNGCWAVYRYYTALMQATSVEKWPSMLLPVSWNKVLTQPWFVDVEQHLGLQMPLESGNALVDVRRAHFRRRGKDSW